MPDLPQRRRTGRPSWTDPIADRLTPTIKAIVIASTVIYLFYVLVREARPLMELHLALGPGLFRGEIWQPLTSLFVHLNVVSFAFNLIGLWWVGATIERTQGTRRFITLFLTAGVLVNVALAGIWQLRAFRPPVYDDGCSYAVLALFVAFGRIFGRAQVRVFGALSMQARTMALIFLGFAAVASLARSDWAGFVATAVAAAVGYLGAAPGGLAEVWATLKARRLRRRYRVYEGGRGRSNKKYMN
jgi:membrane associated rhomboid family serine protease